MISLEIQAKLAEIRNRLNNATPGPWRKGSAATVVSDYPVPGINGSDAVEYFGGHLIGESISEPNREFISHAWQDIKDLLDLLDRQCPRCKNSEINPGDKFCKICGLPISNH